MSASIKISLFGFGDDRPAFFQGQNEKEMPLDKTMSAAAILKQVGFSDSCGLVLMINNVAIAQTQWDSIIMKNKDKLKILSAFEGG